MKRVAFVAHLSEISGSGVALLETVSCLAADYEVYLILPGGGPLADRAVKNGVEPVIIANPQVAITEAGPAQKMAIAANRMRYVLRLRRFFQSRKIDLVYINTSASMFPALSARLAGLPIAWHIHETLDAADRRTRWKKRIIRRWADGLIYASASSMKFLSPPSGTPSIIARNSIRIDDLAPLGTARFASSEAALNSPQLIVMNGTIARKGADVLLRALSVLRRAVPGLDFKLVITGMPPAEPAFVSTLEELGESPALKGRISYAGMQESLAPLLATASVFVSPARNEALPIAIVEAMAAGVPVIATDVGDCADLLNHGKCGWIVPPENENALASAIEEALTQPNFSHAKAETAFAKVMDLYGTENFWQPLRAFLDSL